MKFYQEYVLIAYLVIGAWSQVQGINTEESLRHKEEKGAQGNMEVSKQVTTERDNNLKYTLRDFPSPVSLDDAIQQKLKETTFRIPHNTNIIPVMTKATKKSKRLYTTRKRVRTAAKSYDSETSKISKRSYTETNPKENVNTNLPIQVSFRSQKVYCRQVTRREPDNQGVIIESIRHICAPLPTASPMPGSHSSTKNKHFVNTAIHSSTPKGINCRRVMNSEFNELGEIVDSVTEVCDPPTTTSTTTPRPTTTKVTTTTAKPLIKVCRPVMDSYLNEEGKIMDFVTKVCKMEPTN